MTPSVSAPPITLDSAKIKLDFPILSRQAHGRPLIYLDNAATSQKPKQVIEAITNYYSFHNANVHRGVHTLGDESTTLFIDGKRKIADFFGAEAEELILTRNTTESINQVAWTWAESNLENGDIVLSTEMEHHSNLVPWQEVCRYKGATLKCVGVTASGQLDLDNLADILKSSGSVDQEDYNDRGISLQKLAQGNIKKNGDSRIKLLALTHVSNTLGTVNPLKQIVELVRRLSPVTKILVDGAQAVSHLPVNFDKLDVDFYVMSAHKMLGPMGIGGLLVRKSILAELSPFLFGGGMIEEVSCSKTTYAQDLSDRFTAGTPDVAGVVGWAAACDYLTQIGWPNILQHDQELVSYSYDLLSEIPQVRIIGPAPDKRVGSVAFLYEGVHAHDVAQVLDGQGVAVRSGHHCTMPLHQKFGWQATTRASFQIYNSLADIDAFIEALKQVKKVFGV